MIAQQTQPSLSRSEWHAVSIAFKDAAQCGCAPARAPGPLARIYTKLTGNERRTPLADPRLEAIRSFVCTTRRTRRPAETLASELTAQGFTPAQVDALALLAL